MPAPFAPFFRAATGTSPYDYQCRLAGASRLERPAPSGLSAEALAKADPFPCTSRLISIPTGLGKTRLLA